MMNTKIVIAFIAIGTLMSCNMKNKPANESEEHEEHGTEGVVILNENQREALNLKLDTFQMRNLSTTVKLNGQLEVPPASSAEVTAVIGGNVKKINVFHGDKVSKGQLLATLEHPDYIALQEEFAEIANRLEFLEQEFERQKELFENNVGAGRDYQQAKTELNIAKSKYQGLRSRLRMLNLSPDKVMEGKISNTITINSPINGFINEVSIKLGTYVEAKDKLFDISDNSAIHADFMVYEKDVHLVEKGQKLHFTVSNRPSEELTATVFAIGKEFESNSRAIHVHAKISEQVSDLIPGMYISGHLHTDEKYTRTLNNDAIVAEGTKSYIFILDNDALEEHGHDENGEDHLEEEIHDGHDHDDGHDHGDMDENGHEHDEMDDDGDENGHEHDEMDDEGDEKKMAFRMVEVIPGLKDDGYTEIQLIDPLPENTLIVMNAAYYLLADMKKEETEHNH